MDTTAAQAAKAQSRKAISTEENITSRRRGFEYLNELFIKKTSEKFFGAPLKDCGGMSVLVLGVWFAILS